MEKNCDKCALRLFNDKGYNISGQGNPNYGNLIVLPYIDKDAYRNQNISYANMVKDMQEIIKEETSEDLLDWCYVTSLVKCKETRRCEITDIILRNCFENLIEEFRLYDFKQVLLLGVDTPSKFNELNLYNFSIHRAYINTTNVNFSWNYSPGVKYYNADKFEIFKAALIKWFYQIK